MPSEHPSSAFDQLDPKVQAWIWKSNWSGLHEIQEKSIPILLEGRRDVLIGAATAGGKTEAAFLPIASTIATVDNPPSFGLDALYVSPLKALINDQARRLEDLLLCVGSKVHRWHGDVDSGRKREVLTKPTGVLLITPESLEALFILRGPRVPSLFKRLRYVVIDELHAFIGSERGCQLQSLLHRVEKAAERQIPRVGLSATLGDMGIASEFLRPGGGSDVHQIVASTGHQEVRVQVRSYLMEGPKKTMDADESLEPAVPRPLGEDLFQFYRSGHHLVFANSRADVEVYSDRLRRLAEERRVSNVFHPHHGSLSRSLREDAEEALRDSECPATVLATTTLELGIDVGEVESVGQIGPPNSVSSLRQRLGRSGRRGRPAEVRIFIRCQPTTPLTPPHEQLHIGLVQSIAVIQLLARRWCEPPTSGALHLSTLVQQVLSVIAEKGGIFAAEVYRLLCLEGAFRSVTPDQFTEFLRDLGRNELIVQLHNGELTLGLPGERLVNNYEFYSAFSSPEEYRVVASGRTLGTLPVMFPLIPGTYLIFGGRRWRIDDADDRRRVVHLSPAPGGRAPMFVGGGATVHDEVRREIRSVYAAEDKPPFADSKSLELLAEARSCYRDLGLRTRSMVAWEGDTLVFPWCGDRAMNTILALFRSIGFDVGLEGIVVFVRGFQPPEVLVTVEELLKKGLPNGAALAEGVANKVTEKHHSFLCDRLLAEDYASSLLDLPAAKAALSSVVSSSAGNGIDDHG